MNKIVVIQDNDSDRYVFVHYADNKIVGLNFFQGIVNDLLVFDKFYYTEDINENLTNIYNKLFEMTEISDSMTQVNLAIEMYIDKYIINF